ncbi:CCC motif membrane protein [Paenimyroides aestuarii]|uniref:CCC motif membrane protein n=1 Tax=Paenimyroides aestuarii TaxID=2968490 RepID=A0ABY5NR73_9FLAO|nr:CCC motif membrane protein [Paenimyroides aestuarii]UUV21076.1 CCC motif membrane protein [Paenimyroides aestuarii]
MENYQNPSDPQNYQNSGFNNGNNNIVPSNLPNATAVLVLGILSIIGCCFYGIGVVFGIIALVLASKDMKLYKSNPNAYTNYSTLNTGRILAIIGIVLFIVSIIILLAMGSIVGWDALFNEELAKQRMEEWMQQNQ